MSAAVGLFFTSMGVIGTFLVFICNSQTPLQLGPVPFFSSMVIGVFGLVAFVHYPWHWLPLVIALALSLVASALLWEWLL